MVKIQFTNVGRFSETWVAEIESFESSLIIREIRKKKALLSKEVYLDDDGGIYVGGRCVGCFAVVE